MLCEQRNTELLVKSLYLCSCVITNRAQLIQIVQEKNKKQKL